MKLFRAWPRPPEMSEVQYTRHRIVLATAIAVWVMGFGACVLWWAVMPLWLKIAMGILLFVVSPDVDAVEQVFTPYERYRRERP